MTQGGDEQARGAAEEIVDALMAECDKHGPISPNFANNTCGVCAPCVARAAREGGN